MFKKFWSWYESHYTLNLGIAAGLFLLQIFHLIWLFGEVITAKLFGTPLFELHDAPKFFLIFVDYTEIPAIIAASFVYIDELKNRFVWKPLLYLFFINSQWLHLFWITDEFVVDAFVENAPLLLPAWLAWVAILIDYLELPVIVDTLKRFFSSLKQNELKVALAELKEEE